MLPQVSSSYTFWLKEHKKGTNKFPKNSALIKVLSENYNILITVDVETLREKILSIPCHLTNHHHFPNNQKHKRCSHDDLSQEERNKPWLEEGSKEVAKVKMALTGTDNGRLNDLSKMTGNFFRWNMKIRIEIIQVSITLDHSRI